MRNLNYYLFVVSSFFALASFGQSEDECSYSSQTTNEGEYYGYTFYAVSQPCIRDSFRIYYVNDTCVQLDIYYTVGEAASPCTEIDSIQIEGMGSDEYTVLYTYYYNISLCNLLGINNPVTLSYTDMGRYTLYPNPTRKSISIAGLSVDSKIIIYNVLGQQMISVKADENIEKIDISDLADGTYILEIYGDHRRLFAEKLIIQK